MRNRPDLAIVPPQPVEPPRPCTATATWWDIFTLRMKARIYRLLDRLGCPGIVRNFEYNDLVTGQHLELRLGTFFWHISIDGRDYYFRRLTGKFDGTGYCCGCGGSTPPAGYRSAPTPL